MAEAPAANNFLEIFNSLPPALQGAAVVGVAVGFGLVLWKRFAARFHLESQEPTVLAVGDPTTIADMGPIRDLIKAVATLTDRHVQTEVATNALIVAMTEHTKGLTTGLERLADICGQIMLDLREERERLADEALRQTILEEGKRLALEEIERGKANQRQTRRRRIATKP